MESSKPMVGVVYRNGPGNAHAEMTERRPIKDAEKHALLSKGNPPPPIVLERDQALENGDHEIEHEEEEAKKLRKDQKGEAKIESLERKKRQGPAQVETMSREQGAETRYS